MMESGLKKCVAYEKKRVIFYYFYQYFEQHHFDMYISSLEKMFRSRFVFNESIDIFYFKKDFTACKWKIDFSPN